MNFESLNGLWDLRKFRSKTCFSGRDCCDVELFFSNFFSRTLATTTATSESRPRVDDAKVETLWSSVFSKSNDATRKGEVWKKILKKHKKGKGKRKKEGKIVDADIAASGDGEKRKTRKRRKRKRKRQERRRRTQRQNEREDEKSERRVRRDAEKVRATETKRESCSSSRAAELSRRWPNADWVSGPGTANRKSSSVLSVVSAATLCLSVI